MRTSDRPWRRALALTVALLVAAPAAGEGAAGWRVAAPGHDWSFPRDHWSHPGYRTEWWYLTGHLEAADEPGRRFGFQLTLFRVGLTPSPPDIDSAWSVSALAMGHAAVSDLTQGEHVFSEVVARATPWLGGFPEFPGEAAAAGGTVAWVRAPAGTDGRWSVDWNGRAFDVSMRDDARGIAFDLATSPLRPLIFQGPGGYSRKSAADDAASLYYSFTRLRTEGTLTVAGRTWDVRGLSWMDKEFSTSTLGERQVGWDWFSLQLRDGRDLMLYVLRRADGAVDWGSATVVDASGAARYLPADGWTVSPGERWSAPSGAAYPIEWRVELPGEGLDLRVRAAFPDQENRSELIDGLDYWEGAVEVADPEGNRVGSGYLEMTGYGEGSRPPV